MSGAKFESFIEAVLVKEGYKVYRDQLYGSYGADMIADDGHIEYCVQTKRYSRNVGPAAIREALRGVRNIMTVMPLWLLPIEILPKVP